MDDYNADGWLDLLISGKDNSGNNITTLLKNSSGYFIDYTSTLPNLPSLAATGIAWGDIDNDGLPDLIISGTASDGSPVNKLYRNAGDEGFDDVSGTVSDIILQ